MVESISSNQLLPPDDFARRIGIRSGRRLKTACPHRLCGDTYTITVQARTERPITV